MKKALVYYKVKLVEFPHVIKEVPTHYEIEIETETGYELCASFPVVVQEIPDDRFKPCTVLVPEALLWKIAELQNQGYDVHLMY